MALPQSGAPTPEPRVDKPGFPRGTVRGGLQVQVPTPTQAETPQVRREGKARARLAWPLLTRLSRPLDDSHSRFRCPLARTYKT